MNTNSNVRAKQRLSGYAKQAASKKNAFFGGLWFFLAITTYFFGFDNLGLLWAPVIQMFPVSPTGAVFYANVLGGISAVLVCDVGYQAWKHIKLNSSRTSQQFQVAQFAEWVDVGMSWYYTFAVLLSLFTAYVPHNVVLWMGLLGAVIFVFGCIANGISMYLFVHYAPETQVMQTNSKMRGLQLTERLTFDSKVKEAALVAAAEKAHLSAGRLTDVYADMWELDLIEGTVTEIDGRDAQDVLRSKYLSLGSGHSAAPPPAGGDRPRYRRRRQPTAADFVEAPPADGEVDDLENAPWVQQLSSQLRDAGFGEAGPPPPPVERERPVATGNGVSPSVNGRGG